MKYMMFVCSDTEPESGSTGDEDVEKWVADNDSLLPPGSERQALLKRAITG